jgi:hypothetical protein
MRQLQGSGTGEAEVERAFPRWQARHAPRCPKHPSRAMLKSEENLPKFVAATAGLKHGKRTVWRCRQCPMMVVGATHFTYGQEQGSGWLSKI